ncbi:unnamed protein product [Calypogeia fissa]
MNLYRLAENLRQDVLAIYEKPSYDTSSPIFLVGHGVGGLIIMSLVKAMQDERDMLVKDEEFFKVSANSIRLRKLNCFLRSIRGVFYCATPFQGSELADATKNHPHKGSLLDPLEVFSTETCRIKDWFTRWRRTSFCKAMVFFATLPTLLEGKRHSQVVTEASARGDVNFFYSVQSNHLDFCRPSSKTDGLFQKLVQFIDEESSAEENDPIAPIGDVAKLLEDIGYRRIQDHDVVKSPVTCGGGLHQQAGELVRPSPSQGARPECCPQRLRVTCCSDSTPPSPSRDLPPSKRSVRKELGDLRNEMERVATISLEEACEQLSKLRVVTMPPHGAYEQIPTAIDRCFSIPTIVFSSNMGAMMVPVSLKASAQTSLSCCCVGIDHSRLKVFLKFSKMYGVVNSEDSDECPYVALRSVVAFEIVKILREPIDLSLKDKASYNPAHSMAVEHTPNSSDGLVRVASSLQKLESCRPGSVSLEFQRDGKRRLRDGSMSWDQRVIDFHGSNPVT